jgi:hypothetical protein
LERPRPLRADRLDFLPPIANAMFYI